METNLIILIVVVLVIIFFIGLFNRLVRLKNRVKNAWAQIDVQLKRRADLIPNLINTVKGYAKHEKSLLENITNARSQLMKASDVKSKSKANNMLSETLKSLFAVSENYPDLKANQNFLQLQEELTGTENKISYARQFYNDIVMAFNTKIEVFPNNLFSKILGFKHQDSFEATAAEKKNVKVEF
ncbi:MAG: LemA family protein [Patescibacteria group bacterium]|nr:LemA family protein [Patescibacteria group bacterium]